MVVKRGIETNAKLLVDYMGESIIGRNVNTHPMGEWPGGRAKVLSIYPDKNAPQIVMMVEGLDGQSSDGEDFGEIGVFDHECVELLDRD